MLIVRCIKIVEYGQGLIFTLRVIWASIFSDLGRTDWAINFVTHSSKFLLPKSVNDKIVPLQKGVILGFWKKYVLHLKYMGSDFEEEFSQLRPSKPVRLGTQIKA